MQSLDPRRAADPITESDFPDHAWIPVTTTQSPPFLRNIRAIAAAAAANPADVERCAIEPVHRVTGSFYPSYYTLRHAVRGVIARVSWLDAGMTDEGTNDTGQQVFGFLWKPAAFARPGSVATIKPTQKPAAGSAQPSRSAQLRAAITAVGDVGSDFTPVVSNIKDATIALTGRNPVTGERVGTVGRIASGIFAIPVLGNALKYVAKGGRLAGRALRWLGRTKLGGWVLAKAGTVWGALRGRKSRKLLLSQRQAAKELVAAVREKAGKVVVNIGGTGAAHEPLHAINMNPNVVASRKDIPNLVQERAERIGDVFEPGVVDELVGHRLPHDTLNWPEVAVGAKTALSGGGKVEIYLRWAHAEEVVKMRDAFLAAGFRDVEVIGNAVIKATKP